MGGRQPLDRFSGEFRDSGAIMVGSCTATAPHARILNPAPGSGGSPAQPGDRRTGQAVGAARMRRVLTDPSNTTTSAPGASIGVMPDFRKLIAHELI